MWELKLQFYPSAGGLEKKKKKKKKPEFHSCQILSDVRFCQILSDLDPLKNPSYARSKYPTQLAKMSFDKILDLTAVVFFLLIF